MAGKTEITYRVIRTVHGIIWGAMTRKFDVPIFQTDLEVKGIKVGAWANIGTNAACLPGVTIGKGSTEGARTLEAKDVAPLTIVAGVPADFLKERQEYVAEEDYGNKE